MNRLNDNTRKLEEDVQNEHCPKFFDLIRLFFFVFSKTKVISAVHISAFMLLSLLRPVLAYIWSSYIQTIEGFSGKENAVMALVLIVCYFIINFLVDLISRYVYLLDDMEQLNIVQANRQQELLHSIMYEKLADIPPESLEIPKLNDRIEQVFKFAGGSGVNTSVMLQGYSMAAKMVSVISIAASLFVFNPWLCLIVLLAPLPTIWANTVGQNLQFKFMKDNTKLLRKANYFQKLMLSTAAKEIKIFALHDFIYKKWKDIMDEFTQKEKELIRTRAKFLMIHNFIINFTIVISSVFAIVLMLLGRLSLGGLGAVLTLISTLVSDVKELLTGFATFVMKKNEAAQFFDFMDLPEQKKEGEECGGFVKIKLSDVTYRYPLTDRYVLDGINLTINKGEKVAFVGENGAGKTSLVKLITGILSPSGGELEINGRKVEQINPVSRYDKISIVMQDASRYYTFNIGDNVFLGDIVKERDENKINDALGFSGLESVKKDNLLGKEIGGVDLSGGEWQKLAIARAAYRDKDLIVLDEPTSSIDPLAEAEIFKKYIALAKDKTVVFVTHRISVASLADRIVVLSDGKIVEDGTHEELLGKNGVYSSLYKEQARWYNR